MRIHKLALLIGSVASSTSLAAQSGLNCPSGPGSAFGIVAYQCANCGFKQESGRRPSYTFFAEPVVTQIDRPALASARTVIVIDGVVQGSPAVGDVIEAVDGHPITTQAGADVFAYPAPGSHSLTVRRGRERQVLEFTIPASCDARAAIAATVSSIIDGIHRGSGSGAGGGYGRGVPVIGGDPVEVTGGSRGAVTTINSSPTAGKFGFAVECKPSCSMRRRPNGEYYYKYDGYPRIIEVREHSAADRAGLRVGDLITKVEGRSILAEDALYDLDQREQLHMTVRRDGKDINVVMLVVR